MTEKTLDTHVREGDLVSGKYRVERVLGEGGMGVVVSAMHDQLEQRVALKFLLPSIATRADLVQRFLREARAAVKIHSEHVGRVFDVGTHGAAPYMVMEYLEGADLGEVLESRGPVAVSEAVGWVLEACDAVAEAHALGIVHRDLKPSNLFLTKRPSGKPIVKVLDFGISKAPVSDKERNITNASAIMGSPSYMSPEQMVASATVDARSDIWSLGIVLYELLTKSVPFNAESVPELVGIILQAPPPSVRTRRADVPGALEAVIDRCLQKERERRYANVAELARALAPFAPPRHEAIVERIESVLGKPDDASPSTSASSARAGVASNRTLSPTASDVARPHRSLWIAAAVVAASALGVAAFVATRRPVQKAPENASTATAPSAQPSSPIPRPPPSLVPDPPAPTTEASSSAEPAPTVAHAHPHATAHPTASPSASAGCKTVSFFDQDGNKHFKLECH